MSLCGYIREPAGVIQQERYFKLCRPSRSGSR
ncbi:hypothetical protein SAMN05216229_103186 [Geopseudomonas sagittaria]|uniref:Uncharacterized protein n=1 Tax=Geopseudomonas sagittaria TaxID=1135990 RepID=A0A1I5R626_9GAMM|nr:hypothetical protein SAMN05216229_103186 [Pseudomonas sagittaria]